jgi:hypothetical protein
MIRVRQDGVERDLSYEDFVTEVREGRISPSTPVQSEVLTLGVWKEAGELQFFRSWSPVPVKDPAKGPDREERRERTPAAETHDSSPAPSEPAPVMDYRGEIDVVLEERDEPAATESFSFPPPAPPPVERIPWEEQGKLGAARALYQTIRLAFDDGREFAARVAAGNQVIPALVFGLIVTGLTAIVNATYSIGLAHFMKGLFEQMQAQLPQAYGQSGPPKVRDGIFLVGMTILWYPAMAMIWAGMIHLVLKLTRGAERPFAATFRIASYAVAPTILQVLPVCGAFIGYIWMLALTVRGLMTAQRAGAGSALLAVLIPVLVGVAIFWLGYREILQGFPGMNGDA